MSALDKIKKWHDTKQGLLTFAFAELVLAYVFASWAIDTGSLIDWLLAAMLLFGSILNFSRLLARIMQHGE